MSDIDKVRRDRGQIPSGPRRRRDDGKFQKMMRVEKVPEADWEGKKGKRTKEEEEVSSKEETPHLEQGVQKGKEPSPYEPKAVKGKDTTSEAKPTPSKEATPSPWQPPIEEPEEVVEDVQEVEEAPLEERWVEKEELKHATKKEPEPKEKGAPSKREVKKEEFLETKPEPPPTLPYGAWEASRELEKKEEKKGEGKEKEIKVTSGGPAPLPPSGSIDKSAGPQTPTIQARSEPLAPLSSPFANLPAHIQQLFERMVGVITVMNTSGITETTVNLNNPQFEKSPFFGAEIIITEYSTAPKAFNIQLLGNEEAVRIFNAHSNELLAAFQGGGYNFKVNRIETGYVPLPSEVRRKEARRVKRKKEGGV